MAEGKETKAAPQDVGAPTQPEPTAAELLLMAAEKLERRRGPRAPKHYKTLAARARELAEAAA